MKYEYVGDLQNPNWFDIADMIANGTWDVAEACKKTGRSMSQLRLEMARLGANMQGSSFVAGLATQALNRIEEAEKAAPRGHSRHPLAEPMPEPIPGSFSQPGPAGPSAIKSGVAAGGLSVGKLVGVGLGVLAVAAGLNYARNANRGASLRPGAPGPVAAAAPAIAGTATAPSSLTCTRGEAIVTQMGRNLRSAGDSVTFVDPDTQISNTISWQAPAVSVRIGDDLELASWSTHNGGRPMEVQWDSAVVGSFWAYGASSKDEFRNEGRKITRLPFQGGSVRLTGGVNYGSVDERFRMQWDYYCKS